MRRGFVGPARCEQDAEYIELQQKFYREVFGCTVDFTHLYLLEPVSNHTFPFAIAEDMYDSLVWSKVREVIGFYNNFSEQDLKNMISDRTPYQNYSLWFEDSIEPNPELKNLS